MTETALTVQTPSTIAPYGDRQQVKDLADRMLRCLPGAKAVGEMGALATAQVAISLGLNPFIGEVWPIPQKGGGFSLMAGIKGLRRAAREQAKRDNGFFSTHFRPVRGDEIEGMEINPGDLVRACDVTVSGDRARAHRELTGEIPRFTGIGIYRKGERTRMQPLQVARKRAEADALKQAFDLPLVLAQGEINDPYPETSGDFVDVTPRPRDVHEAIADLYGDVPNTVPPANGSAPEWPDDLFEIGDAEPLDVEPVEAADEPLPVPEQGNGSEPHEWTQDEAAQLFAWTRNELVITDSDALTALGVDRISAYTGDLAMARAAIEAHMANELAQAA